jgi:F-type H+-transporting ATPase subunit delta
VIVMKSNRKARRTARRLFRLCVIGGVVDEGRARQVAARTAAFGGHDALPVLGEFARLVRLDCDRRTALVASALPLPTDVRDGVSAQLARAYGPTIRVKFAVDTALLAGVSIRVGSEVYDGSVRARLAELESRL